MELLDDEGEQVENAYAFYASCPQPGLM